MFLQKLHPLSSSFIVIRCTVFVFLQKLQCNLKLVESRAFSLFVFCLYWHVFECGSVFIQKLQPLTPSPIGGALYCLRLP